MADKEDCSTAAELLDVAEHELVRFEDTPDLFNPPDSLSGWLCRRSDRRYGALVIDTVSGRRIDPHVVLGTPKQHYPFNRTDDEDRVYRWPKAINQCVAFEKFDGTNILGYCYPNGRGGVSTTFKTRLTPTLRGASTHGNFFELWAEVLKEGLAERVPRASVFDFITPRTAASFEMYGHRNHHLISYEEPLAGVWLFSVDQKTGALRPPEHGLGLRTPRTLSVATSRAQLTDFYEDLRRDAQIQNKALDDDHMEGTEGAVLYIQDSGKAWSQWKCKPASVEALHWASDYIPASVIVPTVWNALESMYVADLSVEAVSALLAEEFSAAMVRNSTYRIEKSLAAVRRRLEWRERVAVAYRDCGATFDLDGRGPVMRALSVGFQKSDMRNVFNALKELGIAGNPAEGGES